MTRTKCPSTLLRGPLVEEEPLRSLEDHVALEGRHALEHRCELVRVPGAKRGALRGVVRVQLEDRIDGGLGGAREEELVHVGAEFILGPAMVKVAVSWSPSPA